MTDGHLIDLLGDAPPGSGPNLSQPRHNEDAPADSSAIRDLPVDLFSHARSRHESSPIQAAATVAASAVAGATVQPISHTMSHPPAPLSLDETSPLCLPTDWLPQGWELQKRRKGMSHGSYPRRPVAANFIVPDPEGLFEGVVEATHTELTRKEGRYGIDLQGTAPNTFIHIETSSERDTRKLVEMAQEIAAELISDRSVETSALFQEPLAAQMKNIAVAFDIQGPGAKPKLDCPSHEIQKHDEPRAFVMDLSRALHLALKKTARQQSGLTLRAHLGYFVLQTYPRSRSSIAYEQFKTMVDSPRATGRLVTEMSDINVAREVLATIQQNNSPLLPSDNQIPSAADVVPAYVFEAHWQEGRVQANIFAMHDAEQSTNEGPRFQMNQVRTFLGSSNLPELNFTILSIARKFDWGIEASRDQEVESASTANLSRFLMSATIRLRGSGFECHPHIALRGGGAMGSALRNISIKSLYHFRWKTTSYIVEIAINHRWGCISDLSQPPKVDFSVSIYGEHWDRRSQDTQVVGNAWGDDLDLLFNDGDDTATAGVDRVSRFVGIVQDIQAILEKAAAKA